ncbi:MAG: sensor histidine kinase [Chitinophagaceae bacterium]|nr:sensor histidine kinase [Chitinophagaceae bacterium]
MAILATSTMVRKLELRNFIADTMQQHPFIFSDERKYRIRRHLAFWIFWWIFQAFLYSFIVAKTNGEWLKRVQLSSLESLVYLFAHMFLAYSLMYIVIPRFLLQQRYWLTIIITALLFVATAGISVSLSIYILDPIRLTIFNGIFANTFRNSSVNIFLSLMAGLRGAITIGGIAAAIKLMKYWYLKEQRNMQLQKENMTSQLQLLKAQVHPHFLFNTLNNIYSYTQSNSAKAAQMVSGLSDLLRYMLYECNQPLAPLSKELQMVKDYISLEQIRYGNKLELHLEILGDTKGLYIAPLLLLPLIENCFKHGTSHILEQPWVNLQISIHEQQLTMKLINGKVNVTPEDKNHSGIGIQNVQKRLSLLYPDKHELTITNEEEVFIVNLKVKLEELGTKRTTTMPEAEIIHA